MKSSSSITILVLSNPSTFSRSQIGLTGEGQPLPSGHGPAARVGSDVSNRALLPRDAARTAEDGARPAPGEPFPLARAGGGGQQADSTFTFPAQRFVASWQLLDCQGLTNIAAPIALRADPDTGMVTAASIDRASLNSDIASIAGSLDSDNRIYSN
jgi:hypothetical protein